MYADLLRTYQAQTDEELLALAADSQHLTSEAYATLQGELTRRRISPALEGDQGMSDVRTPRYQTVTQDSQTTRFLAQVVHIYHSHFWLFIQLIAPAVIVSYAVLTLRRIEVREMTQQFHSRRELNANLAVLLKISLLNLTSFCFSWTFFCCSFAAICSAVARLANGEVPGVRDYFSGVRQRTGAFLRLSLALFILFLIAAGVGLLFSTATFWFWRSHLGRLNGPGMLAVTWGWIGLTMLALSRLGLSMPALILDNCTIRQAFYRSSKRTVRRWLTLTALLTKFLVGSYVAATAPYWLASWILAGVPRPEWFSWVLTIASVSGVIVVDPTMFIGLALLYIKAPLDSDSVLPVLMNQEASVT